MEIYEDLDEILKNHQGRIWVIESENTTELVDEIDNKYSINKLDEKQFKQAYKNYSYTVELIEK